MARQLKLFDEAHAWPEGLVYRSDAITPAQESDLLARIESLPFRNFEFHGFRGNRRTVSYGAHYDFEAESVTHAPEMPDFLQPFRAVAATLAGLSPDDLRHVLITEYPPGAAIGWHKDKRVFDKVVGLSLLSPCTFRLRRRRGETWERASFVAEPRSAYVLQGAARSEWEHSIPAVEQMRYSLTFRSMRQEQALRST